MEVESVYSESRWELRRFGVTNKSSQAKKKLIIVLIICFIWMVVEIIASSITNSLALLTDAIDLLKDQKLTLVTRIATMGRLNELGFVKWNMESDGSSSYNSGDNFSSMFKEFKKSCKKSLQKDILPLLE